MHGHFLGGSRKLNRHWQSGSKSFQQDPNLIYLEKEIDPDLLEWPSSDSPYLVKGPSDPNYGFMAYDYPYTKSKKYVRNQRGFMPFIIKEPGDYQLHWDLEFREVQMFTRDGQTWFRLTDKTRSNVGMYAVLMYGAGHFLTIATQSPYSTIETGDGFTYYTGQTADYIANQTGGPGSSSWAAFYTDNEYLQYVSPYRKNTSGWFFGANSFNNKDTNEEPPLIFHIDSVAPFISYQITKNTTRKEVWFEPYNTYSSPRIEFRFVNNGNSFSNEYIVTGKIWLERIGDYTETQRGWLPRIEEAPEGWTILGDGGIIS